MTTFRVLSQFQNRFVSSDMMSSLIRIIRGRSAALIPVLLLAFLSSARSADKPVSFYKDITPIFKRSCTGCHHPGKLKGELDLTTYAAFKKGGKHGAAFKPNDLKDSVIIDEIGGKEPSMPKEGDPLTAQEVAMIEKWIKSGAPDDTPANANSFKLAEPPTYTAAPVITALAFSPDGKVLAISGYHEVILHSPTGSNIIARLLGESPRIESLAYSPDGKMLGVAGSAPARFGEIQIWDTATNGLLKSYKISIDSVYGLSFSPEGDRVAVGCADKSVRVLAVKDGKELLKFDNHSDWVFATTFTVDGKRLLSGGRDRAMKLIDASNGQFIDDINKLLEGVLCFSRHPKEDKVAYGGDLGSARIYKIAENQGRTAANNDVNLVKELERLPGPIHAISFSPDGNTLAVGGVNGELRLYSATDGKRTATLKGQEGAVFA
ncbi:MAG TPA: c-type cytochrome domain-containing protein, partial [Verrucomicrobiae bacterium]|nr:c-type cytochrome domain-containing protein [Verrucomicrobiae bacterium]